MLKELFTTLAQFTQYVQSVDTTNTLDDLAPSARLARKAVESMTTAPVYNAIIISDDEELLEALRSAIANRTMAHHVSFDAVNRRRSGGSDTYRYEVEQMQRNYMQGYYAAMDELLRLLDSNIDADDTSSPAAIWQNSRYGRLLAQCRLRRTEDFDLVYPIDLSYHFFYRTVPLQVESLTTRLQSYYTRIAESGSAPVLSPSGESVQPSAPVPEASASSLQSQLDLALAKLTIAKALRRFDIAEFPATLRNLFTESKESRTARDERTDAQRLAADLEAEVNAIIENVDMVLSDYSDHNYCSTSAYNTPDDLIIMAP